MITSRSGQIGVQVVSGSWQMSTWLIYRQQVCRNPWGFPPKLGVWCFTKQIPSILFWTTAPSISAVLSKIVFLNTAIWYFCHILPYLVLNPNENVWVAMSKYMLQDHTYNHVAVVNNALQAWEHIQCEEGCTLTAEEVAFIPLHLKLYFGSRGWQILNLNILPVSYFSCSDINEICQ